MQKLSDILDRLDASHVVEDMRYPGSDLHQLKGPMKGFWAVNISGNWRVVFTFKEGNALALRLSKAFKTTPELWLNLQRDYDLWEAAHKSDDWKLVEAIAV